MTEQQHPITPPPELMEQWLEMWPQDALLAAAQWGADQELDACCEWHRREYSDGLTADLIRSERRPKPPSLKEQALALINHDPANQPFLSDKGIDIIRRALEQLDV